jgi:hypothetical protein
MVARRAGQCTSRAGNELIFGYTTTSSPWLHDEQGVSKAGSETVLGDGSDERNVSDPVLVKFSSALAPERIFYFMKLFFYFNQTR